MELGGGQGPVLDGGHEVLSVGGPGGQRRAGGSRAQEDGEATGFIGNAQIFGDLADDERFRSVYAEELAALRAQGARARLRALVAEG